LLARDEAPGSELSDRALSFQDANAFSHTGWRRLQKTSLKKKSKWTKVSLEKAVGAGVMPRGKTLVALRPPYGPGFYTD